MEIIIPLIIILVIVTCVVARGLDTDRVKEYIESRGGKMLEKHWAPFGKGWFGDKSDRIYQVRYLDRDGNEHQATCKTSMWAGVYWTEDNIVKHARPPDVDAPPEVSLEEENRRLREEIGRLRRGKA